VKCDTLEEFVLLFKDSKVNRMKKCSKCGILKPLNEFYKDNWDNRRSHRANCMSCVRKRQKQRYNDGGGKLLLKLKMMCRKNKRKSIEYKGGRCVDCVKEGRDGIFSECAYCFHHTDPTEKEYGISTLMSRKTWKSITGELDKCVLLCLNCHSIRHYTGKL
jgi:hypothetical protein